MDGLWPFYMLLFLVVVVWMRIEAKNKTTSNGINSIVSGSVILSFGFALAWPDAIFFRFLTHATGFAMAFYGVAKLVVHLVKNDL